MTTERDFQRAVMDLAELSGWETFHCRTSMQQGRYLTATTGTMAKGWPDLVLVRGRRLIFVELKADKGRLTDDQGRVLELLGRLMVEAEEIPEDMPVVKQRSYLDGVFEGMYRALKEGPQVEVHVWRPADWDTIEATLTNRLEDSDAAA